MTKGEIDRLGERLKMGPVAEEDLKLLDEYRASFTEAYEHVVHTIRSQLHLVPTGRQSKTTESIIAKLKREGMRLSRIQDIAGCRVTVENVGAQNEAVESLRRMFPDARFVDRRVRPSHGYRAVHVIVNCNGKLIEVQIRTVFQDFWAQLCEKVAGTVDPSIKYGGGPDWIQDRLDEMAQFIMNFEALDRGEQPARKLLLHYLTNEGQKLLAEIDRRSTMGPYEESSDDISY